MNADFMDGDEKPEPTYLGDGVYASMRNGMIRLDANSHSDPSDTIYLEPGVFAELVEYARRQGWMQA